MSTDIVENIITVSIICSFFALAVLMARKFSKAKGLLVRNIIWIVLLLRLLIPVMINVPFGLFESQQNASESNNYNYYNIIADSETVSETLPLQESRSSENIALEENTTSKVAKYTKKLFWLDVIVIVYFLGLALSIAHYFFKAILLHKSLSKIKACDDIFVLDLFMKTKSTLNIKRNIPLLIEEQNVPPAVCGIFRTRIILPKSATENTSGDELEYIFIHELTHYKKLDVLKLFLMEIVLCIHWFNPILYYVKNAIVQDIELACDESVIDSIQKDKHAVYAQMLINFSSHKTIIQPLVLTSNLAVKKAKHLKERIIMIKKFKKSKFGIISFAVIVLISLLLIVLTSCKNGVEATMDSELTTNPSSRTGTRTVELNSMGKIIAENEMVPLVDGNDVVLTIDPNMQKKLEKILEQHINEAFNKITSKNTDNEVFDNMFDLIKNWCENLNITYEEQVYRSVSIKLLALSQINTSIGSQIRSILSDDLGLTPQQIIIEDTNRLDNAIAELILLYK